MKKFFVDNSLSLVFLVLFVLCLWGQALTGVRMENSTRAVYGQPALDTWQFVRTGTFLQGVFSNWQAAILQLGALIVFGTFLHQKGAPHSKKKGREGERHGQEQGDGDEDHKGEPEGRDDGCEKSWLQRHSMGVAFAGLFLVAFALHLLSGRADYNSELLREHQATLSLGAFAVSAKFWFATLQTWEAEFMAIALYVLLSVFLRQEGSPESKPVDSGNEDTGKPNE